MPGFIDSHVHITTGVAFEYIDLGVYVPCSNKREALDFMVDYIHPNATKGVELYAEAVLRYHE